MALNPFQTHLMRISDEVSEMLDRRETCIPRRCGICHFELQKNQDIVLSSGRSGRVCLRGFVNDVEGNLYHICRGQCSEDHPVTPYHTDCLRMIPEGKFRCLVVIATPAFESVYREAELRDTAATNLLVPLPNELKSKIVEDLGREYAMALLGSLRFGEPATPTLDVSLPLRLNYTDYEARRHISHVENVDGKRIMPAGIFLSESPFGVTRVVLSADGSPPVTGQEPGVWWKGLAIQAKEVMFCTDGYKLRALIHQGESTTDLPYYSVPQPLTGLRVLDWTANGVPSSEPLMMQHVNYNYSGITGLSIRCAPHSVDFHFHTDGEDYSFYEKEKVKGNVWLYMPLDPEERISTVWSRHYRGQNWSRALTFCTTKGQTLVGGPAVMSGTPTPKRMSWRLVDSPNGREGSFLFDDNSSDLRQIAFASPKPRVYSPHWPPQPCLHMSPRPKSPDFFYHSSASLEDVTEVRQCRRDLDGEGVEVMGLLLTYANGAVASLGQVRLDLLGQPRYIVYPDKLWLGFRCTFAGHYRVSEVQFLQPREEPGEDSLSWINIPWSGKLEWWFSFRQHAVSGHHYIRHNGVAIVVKSKQSDDLSDLE